MEKIILDALMMEEVEATHKYLKEMLKLPEYYGFNLDALYDCLTDECSATLTIRNSEEAGAYFNRVLEVMLDAQEENEELHVELE